MKKQVIIIVSLALFFSYTTFAQETKTNDHKIKSVKTGIMNSTDKLLVKDSDANMLLEVNDEGTMGSITLPDTSTTLGSATNKLYNLSGALIWNGDTLSTSGVSAIDDLIDGKTLGGSVFLGSGAGAIDDGSDNKNTAVGFEALNSNTQGYYNTANGYRALFSNTQNYNTANGYEALYSNTTGFNNTANGYQALFSNTNLSNNTAIGYHALYSNTTGERNTATGSNALSSNTGGDYNTANGFLTLSSNMTGNRNTAAGAYSLQSNTVGDDNIATGYWALHSNTSGHSNIAIGYRALSGNIIGSNNIGIGYEANFYNQEGSDNTIIGVRAGYGTSPHNKSGNVFIGYRAGYNETGSNKLYIENSNSSTPLIGGDFSEDEIYLNGDVGINTSNPEGSFHIKDAGSTGPAIFLENATASEGDITWNSSEHLQVGTWDKSSDTFTERMRITSSGNVGIGTTSPSAELEVGGRIEVPNNDASEIAGSGSIEVGNSLRIDGNEIITNTDERLYLQHSNNGDLRVDNTTLVVDASADRVGIGTTSISYKLEVDGSAGKPGGGSWSNSSDIRLKDIKGDYVKGLEAINQLSPIRFRYKEDNPRGLPSDTDEIGFVAQEVRKSFPEAVSDGEDGYLDFNMHSINVAMVNAVKELSSQNKKLEYRINNLEDKNKELRNALVRNDKMLKQVLSTLGKNETRNVRVEK